MAGKIQGITIVFEGETTELDKALKKISKESHDVDDDLRQINRSLKFNPNNVELMKQKFDTLNKKINVTDKQLKELRDAEKQLKAQGVSEQSAEFMKVRREIIEADSKLKHFEAEMKKLKNIKLKALGEQFKKVGDKMSSMGKSMSMYVTAPIVAGYTAAANYASDYEENLNKIDVAFGKNSDSVKEWANNARGAFGMSKVQATSAVSAFGALGKGIGISEEEAAKMSTTLTGLSADLGSYFNTSTDDSAKALEGIFTGESEALKKFGVIMTDTNLKKFAEDQGLVYSELTQTEKTMLRYNYVLANTKDAQGDFSRTSDGTANSLKLFQSATQDLATAIGTNLLPIITPIIQKITEIVNKFNELSPTTQKVITIIGIIVAALGPLLVVAGTLISAIGSIMGAAGALSGVFAALAGPVGIAIAAIAAAIAIGIALYKNWDKIKAKAAELAANISAKFNALKAKVKGIFTAIANAMLAPIKNAVNLIKAMIDKIKNFFHFKVNLPHMKLPHFKISPAGWKLSDLLKGKIPKLGIDWYAQGGIFDRPSVIGVGEAGSEAVVPLDKLWRQMAQMQGGDNITINVVAPEGASVQAIAREVERRLIETQKRRRLAWQ